MQISLNGTYVFFCQTVKNEKLLCPASIQREGYDPFGTYKKIIENIGSFRELDSMPCAIFLPEECAEASILQKNMAKYHKLCVNKFSELKLERAKKKFDLYSNQSFFLRTLYF